MQGPQDDPLRMGGSVATVLLVPGLRDHVAAHWQTLLAADLEAEGRPVRAVAPMGREDLDCRRRVDAIEEAAQRIDGPLVIVAHSAGCIMLVHWAARTQRVVRGALLATPPDFDAAMPDGYPTIAALDAGGWLPVPRRRLVFPSIVAASRNDPLGRFARVAAMAADWGSTLVDIGLAGHLNPSSGHGHWPQARDLVSRLN